MCKRDSSPICVIHTRTPMPCLFVVFKKTAATSVEKVVQWYAGPMVHVDVIPGDQRVMYTSYMFETFSVNRVEGYTPDTHVCLSLPVTQEEHDDACALLLRLVEKRVPYNYADLLRCVIPLAVPEDLLCVDEITTLYCSQAVALVLKAVLRDKEDLVGAMRALNSRTTTPTLLYNALLPFSEPADSFMTI